MTSGAGRSPTTERLFEKVCLEGFQAGLELAHDPRKRESLPPRVPRLRSRPGCALNVTGRNRLLQDENIVRHRGKIESTINNAIRARGAARRTRLAGRLLLGLAPGREVAAPAHHEGGPDADDHTPASLALSADSRKRGWSFVGPTTIYAFMQAMGLVNDHVHDCYVRASFPRLRVGPFHDRRKPEYCLQP